MAELVVRFDVRFGGRAARGLMAAAMFFAAVPELASESVTLTTYYPAPSGVYAQMITTGNTYLARDGGAVRIGSAVPPVYKLDVVGDIHSTSWVRTDGATGWYSQTYGGGWYMADGTWIRSFGSKPVYMSNGYDSATPSGAGCGGGLGGGYMFQVCGTEKVAGDVTVAGNVNVTGNVNASGHVTAGGTPGYLSAGGRYLYAAGASCYSSSANNGTCAGGYYITWAPGVFEDNGGTWWYTGPTVTVTAIATGLGTENSINMTSPVYWCCAM